MVTIYKYSSAQIQWSIDEAVMEREASCSVKMWYMVAQKKHDLTVTVVDGKYTAALTGPLQTGMYNCYLDFINDGETEYREEVLSAFFVTELQAEADNGDGSTITVELEGDHANYYQSVPDDTETEAQPMAQTLQQIYKYSTATLEWDLSKELTARSDLASLTSELICKTDRTTIVSKTVTISGSKMTYVMACPMTEGVYSCYIRWKNSSGNTVFEAQSLQSFVICGEQNGTLNPDGGSVTIQLSQSRVTQVVTMPLEEGADDLSETKLPILYTYGRVNIVWDLSRELNVRPELKNMDVEFYCKTDRTERKETLAWDGDTIKVSLDNPVEAGVWSCYLRFKSSGKVMLLMTVLQAWQSSDMQGMVMNPDGATVKLNLRSGRVYNTVVTPLVDPTDIARIGDLTDVDTTTHIPQTNEVLIWNGEKWVAGGVKWSEIGAKPSWVTQTVPDLGDFGNEAGYIKNINAAMISGALGYAPIGGVEWSEIGAKPSWVTQAVPDLGSFGNEAGYIKKSEITKKVIVDALGYDPMYNYCYLRNLKDVNLSDLEDGNTLVYNAATAKWVAGTAIGGGGGNMEGYLTIEDAAATYLTIAEFRRWFYKKPIGTTQTPKTKTINGSVYTLYKCDDKDENGNDIYLWLKPSTVEGISHEGYYWQEGDTVGEAAEVDEGDIDDFTVVTEATTGYAIGTTFPLFSEQGVSAYGYGASEENSGVYLFSGLDDVPELVGSEIGQVWGVKSDGTWGLITVQCGGSGVSWGDITQQYATLKVGSDTTGKKLSIDGHKHVNSDLEYSGMDLWGNSVALGGTTKGSITMQYGDDETKQVVLEVDDNGNLKVNGNIYATGGISAYQYGASEQTLVANFTELLDVKAVTAEIGKVWGVKSDGTWGLVSVQSGTSASFGSVSNGYLPITIGGTTKNVAVLGHTHGYYTKPDGGIPNTDLEYSGMDLWGNSVVLGGATKGSITMQYGNDETKQVVLEVDDNGNLKVNGNIYATGGISAYQYGASEQTLVANFTDLLDVKAVTAEIGKVWGVKSDGTWGLITVQSGTSASFGTEKNGYVPLTIGGKTYNLSKYGHTHANSDLEYSGMTLWGNTVYLGDSCNSTIKIADGNGVKINDVWALHYSTKDSNGNSLAYPTLLIGHGFCEDGKTVALSGTPLIFQTYYSGNRTERARITADGKVGIGTTSPSKTLTVSGSADFISGSERLIIENISGRFSLAWWDANVWKNANIDANYLSICARNSNGKVGIGVLAPTEKLHVNGDVRVGDARLRYDSTNNCLFVESPTGGVCNLASTGGISAYGGVDSYATLANLTVTTQLNVGNKIQFTSGKNNSNITIQNTEDPDDEEFNNSIIISSHDSFILQPGGGTVLIDGGIQVGKSGSKIENVKVSGGYLYLTYNAKTYKVALSD